VSEFLLLSSIPDVVLSSWIFPSRPTFGPKSPNRRVLTMSLRDGRSDEMARPAKVLREYVEREPLLNWEDVHG
jgi:hypothetical protein